jgi:hypothetical protein
MISKSAVSNRSGCYDEKSLDQLVVPNGWVLKSQQNEERLRIVGIDLSGQTHSKRSA